MISGRLEPDGRAVVPVAVAGHTFDAVIDTGFDGGVSLPDVLLPILNPPIRTHTRYQLGDGSQVVVPVYEVVVELGGSPVTTEALFSTSDEVLLGVVVLRGYRLEIDYPAGTVRLLAPSRP